MTLTANSTAPEGDEALVDRFNAAWNAHDLDAAMALVSIDLITVQDGTSGPTDTCEAQSPPNSPT